MNIHLDQNNIYEDSTFGTYGIFIFGLFAFFPIALYVTYGTFLFLITETPVFTENYIGILFTFIFMFASVLWISTNTCYASQTIQQMEFNENSIFIRLYFLRKRFFDTKELKNVEDFKITRLMSQIETFPKDGTGFFY